MDSTSFLLLLAGPSGAGKSSVLKPVVESTPRVRFSISCTTRQRRAGETDGVEYHFLSEEEFLRARDAGEFVEWAQVHDHLYGTREADLNASLERGEIPLLEIDVQGGRQIMERFPGQVVSVFLAPPDFAVLEQRLRDRGSEDERSLERRLENAKSELAERHLYRHEIVNDDLAAAQERLRAIIEAEIERRGSTTN